jgi:hypothetical protein
MDLTNAVVTGNSSGYIAKLKADTTLQRNFDTAIGQIYDPTQ